MPVYNDGNSVEKAIESIFDQDWPEIEVIAVNDASKDNTKEVLAKLAKKHKNLTVVNFEKNRGACHARNEGAKLATGKYFAWLPADAKLYPGVARVWVETLEFRNEVARKEGKPEFDFLYGGYKFVDDQGNTVFNYWGDVYDPYMLEVGNYIDGTFPIKAETYWRVAKEMNQPEGLWDPNIISLQDWDFWLSVVRHGGNGLYYKDIFFETTMPHPGGLSDDSHRNWLARCNAIKIKQGIPIRKICVTSPGAPFFGKYIAKLLNADYKDAPQVKDHNYDMIYLLGFYPSIAEQCSGVFVDPKYFAHLEDFVNAKKEVPLSPSIRVVHLIGTDLLQMSMASRLQMEVYKHFLNVKYDWIFTEFEPTQKEAKELGIRSNVLGLPPRKFFEPTSFPKDFTVAVYAPEVNQALYNVDIMEKVAKKLPKVKFKFFGNPGKKLVDGNIEYMGYVNDMEKFVSECSCLMRITVHDGLPQAVIEFLSAGRRVIFNHDFKFVNTANKQLKEETLVKAIKEEMGKGLNEEAAKWVRKEFAPEKYIKKINSLMNYDPKEFWENFAEKWNIASKRLYDTRDWEFIEPWVKEINPKSVIDLGCGNGQWSEHFEQDYLGVDISEKLIKEAKKRYPDKEFMASKLEDLKIDKKYDLAFCYTLFEHIKEEDMPQAIEALKKVSKKAILIEPAGFKTSYYCIDHDYSKWLKIKKQKQLGPRTMMLVEFQ